MPKAKARKPASSDSDSGPDDRTPAKKSKSAPAAKPAAADREEDSWEIGRNRFVKLSEFKGKWYVSIREFYDADGELRPGKKGIMMTMEQWQKFKSCMPELEEAIKRRV